MPNNVLEWYKTLDPRVWPSKKNTEDRQGGVQAPITGYTGAGPDGKVQPNMPIQMMNSKNGPVMLHEGEATAQLPNGNMQVIPQKKLQEIEKTGSITGMQNGGVINKPYSSEAEYRANNNPNTSTIKQYNPQPDNVIKTANDGGRGSITGIAPSTTTSISTVDDMSRGPITGLTPPDPTITHSITEEKPVTGETKAAPDAMETMETITSKSITEAPTTVPTEETTTTPPTDFAAPDAPEEPEVPTMAEQDRELGLDVLRSYARGDATEFDAMVNNAINMHGGATAAATAALKQEAAQAGMSPHEIGAMMQLRARDVAGSNAQLAADLASQGRELQRLSATTLASEGLAGMKFDQLKKEYADREEWKEYDKAIQAGEFDIASQVFESITGKKPTMNELRKDLEHSRIMEGIDEQKGQLGVEMDKLNISVTSFADLMSKINNGANIDYINNNAPDSDGDGFADYTLTKSQYDNLRQNYEMGLEIDKLDLADARHNHDMMVESDTGVELSKYLQRMRMSEPNYSWMNDEVANDKMQAYWESTGKTGPFDFAWAKNQYLSASMNQFESSVAEAKNALGWNDLDDETKAGYDKLFDFMIETSVTDGFHVVKNPDGTGADAFFIADMDGNVIAGNDLRTSDQKQQEQAALDYYKIVSELYPETMITMDEIRQYGKENNYDYPDFGSDFMDWKNSTGNVSKITDYFSGSPVDLDNKDMILISKIREAKAKPEEERTEQEKYYASSVPYEFIPPSGIFNTYDKILPTEKVSKDEFAFQYSKDLFNEPEKLNETKIGDRRYQRNYYLGFSDDVRSKIDEYSKSGGLMEYNGNYYLVDPINPVVEKFSIGNSTTDPDAHEEGISIEWDGNDETKFFARMSTDGIRLKDPNTGENFVLIYGSTFGNTKKGEKTAGAETRLLPYGNDEDEVEE